MPHFAGLDVGLHKTALCIVDGDSKVLLERSLASGIDDVVTALRAFGKEIGSVGLEVWITLNHRGTSSRVFVTSWPSLDRVPWQHGQAVGPEWWRSG